MNTGGHDCAAQRLRKRLQAIADSQQRQAAGQQVTRQAGRIQAH